MMARIVNLERFFAQVRTREERTFLWEVKDQIIPENNGIFRISLGPEGGRAVRLETGRMQLEGRENRSGLPGLQAARTPDECLDIASVPERLGPDNPFSRAMICEVV
mgnify:CR=1 FL=1